MLERLFTLALYCLNHQLLVVLIVEPCTSFAGMVQANYRVVWVSIERATLLSS